MGSSSSKTAAKTHATPSDTKKKRILAKKYPIYGSESIMSRKAHGTSETPVQKNLRWNCDYKTADRISNYNRHYAEHAGYFSTRKAFLKEMQKSKKNDSTIVFYDSNTGNPLFEAPKGRSWDDFISESKQHGWPSFRDEEVNWEHVRCLKNGESVSLDGTHLGHNLPDSKGNRYCINLVSVAGRPTENETSNDDDAQTS